eukprot:gene3327-3604_t
MQQEALESQYIADFARALAKLLVPHFAPLVTGAGSCADAGRQQPRQHDAIVALVAATHAVMASVQVQGPVAARLVQSFASLQVQDNQLYVALLQSLTAEQLQACSLDELAAVATASLQLAGRGSEQPELLQAALQVVDDVAAEAVRRWKSLTAAEQRKLRSIRSLNFQQQLPTEEAAIMEKLDVV